MDTVRVAESQAYTLNGATNHILLRWGTFDAHNLLVTWVDVEPGGQQRGHTHPGAEQAYVFISGTARMQVGAEKQIVSAGTLVYVPPNNSHAIYNTGKDKLVYLTVASPPFAVERLFAQLGTEEVQA
jgi:mannose-6-phosphate isomerase-like protein (cupin superfamily)